MKMATEKMKNMSDSELFMISERMKSMDDATLKSMYRAQGMEMTDD